MAKERKYSERELKRMALLEEMTQEYRAKGYTRVDQIISIKWANIAALLLAIPIYAGFHFWFYQRNHTWIDLETTGLLVFLILLVVGVVLHELVHGFFWAQYAEHKFQKIEFGFIKESLTPYCTCGEPLPKKGYLIGALMPGFLTGLLPAVIGVLCGSYVLMEAGVILLLGAAGDWMITWKLLRYRSTKQEVVILDHPSEGGFVVFEK